MNVTKEDLEEMNPMLSLLRGIKPPSPEIREHFKGTNFLCDCGGDVWPQTMTIGVCFSCKQEWNLADCYYDTEQEE